jgi:hypothetical protein
LPEYGRFSDYRRKEVGFQVEVLLQQGYLELDSRSCLVPVSGVEQGGVNGRCTELQIKTHTFA